MTSSIAFGRSRSASGVAGLTTANRSVGDDIGTGRGREAEQFGAELGISFKLGHANHGPLAEVVENIERDQSAGVEAQAQLAKRRVLVLRRRAEPFESVRRRQIAPFE